MKVRIAGTAGSASTPASRGRAAVTSHLDAYVLHRYDWSESSLILELFTRERGRIAVAAKGAKRPYSQLRAVLLPFQRIQVSLGRSPADEHAEIHNLRQAEWAGGGPMLSGAALFSGFYLNELLLKLLARHDPHPALFDAYRGTLPALAAGHEGLAQAALRGFELLLLRETGLAPRDTVLVFQPMSAELYVALLALFRLGITAMFLDPSAGRDHIEQCCAIRPPKAMIASTEGATWVVMSINRFHSSRLNSFDRQRTSAPISRCPITRGMQAHKRVLAFKPR